MTISRTLLTVPFLLWINTSLFAQSIDVDITELTELVGKWNAAHNNGEVDDLLSLYAERVDYYGREITRDECLSKKRKLFEEFHDFGQTLKKDVLISAYENGIVRCDFTTTVTQDKNNIDRDLYLLMKLVGDQYLIVGESDLATDRKIDRHHAFGKKLIIKNVSWLKKLRVQQFWSSVVDVVLTVAYSILAAFALLFLFRKWNKGRSGRRFPSFTKRRTGDTSPTQDQKQDYRPRPGLKDNRGELWEKGYEFEKYVVTLFDKRFYTLLDWRSDKFHEGIYAKSMRDPDLVYEYRFEGHVRKFSVECKYRSKLFHDSVTLMDQEKYNIYETYHKNVEPVYIVLGLNGSPTNPRKLYLIPFKNVKLEMSLRDLAPYYKPKRAFYYDLRLDALR